MKSVKTISLTVVIALICSTAIAQSAFVPGKEIIFEDNLSGEKAGTPPSKWTMIFKGRDGKGKAEVTNLNGQNVIMLIESE